MSYTILYKIGNGGEEIGSVFNSWRGAMYVWVDISRKYFGWESFPFVKEQQKCVWNAWKYHNIQKHELIVLLSTLDNAVVGSSNIKDIIISFKKYGEGHPSSSLSEQALILEKINLGDNEFVAWQQTSVGEFWGLSPGMDGNEIWYDPNNNNSHFDVAYQANSIINRNKQKQNN